MVINERQGKLMKLVLATHNKGKIREFQKVFSEIGWEAVPVADVSDLSLIHI